MTRILSRSRNSILAIAVSLFTGLTFLTNAQDVWDGEGPDGNWMTPLNWNNNIAPTFPQGIGFAGGINLNTVNDYVDAVVNGITFHAGADAFTLGGNGITLGGNIVNESATLQSIDLSMTLNGTRIFDARIAPLAINGNLSGSAASAASQEATLLGTGSINGMLSSGPNANAGLRLNVNNAIDNSSLWTVGGNNTYSFGGQFVVSRGTLNFGSATEAPDVTITRVSGGNVGEFMVVGQLGTGTSGTFNMNNGSLTLNDGQNNMGTTSVRIGMGNTSMLNGAPSGTAEWNQTGGTVTLQGFNVGSSPGVFLANQNGTTVTMNLGGGAGPALFDAADAAFMAAVRGSGTVNINNNGILRSTGAGPNPSGAVLGITVNDDRQSATALSSVGTVNLNSGGTLEATAIRMTANRGGQPVTAIFNFNGGVWRFSGNNASLVYGGSGSGNDTATVNVGAGGAKIDKNGFDGTIAMALLHNAALGSTADGGLDVDGLGNLTLTAASTFTGDTRLRAGALTIAASGILANTARVIVDPGATLTLQSENAIGAGSILDLVNGSAVNLDFAGTLVLADILLNGVSTGNGLFDAADLNSLMPGGTFAGTGLVLVPEPSALSLCGFGLMAWLGWRRLKAAR